MSDLLFAMLSSGGMAAALSSWVYLSHRRRMRRSEAACRAQGQG
ncbi:hypothetical protein [Paracraurococcus lichenis]|uniref:Uncharacterized protein n=1 Tax=Paracraurococcus lichenis TaxID=3064888 RepID=A0ABT9E0L2_9PROT|nr:hypothetical protein [Paracraurococcus sp. LOR1-02]MDO9709704.1 hypothetical protein [Paracraurococcus sp. LOR1-02]